MELTLHLSLMLTRENDRVVESFVRVAKEPSSRWRKRIMAGRIGEATINDKIGEILREMNPQWGEGGKRRVVTESTRMLAGSKGKKPDIVVQPTGEGPVVIESEYHPAQYLEKDDARPRLGEKVNGKIVKQVIALRIPKELGDADPVQLTDKVRNAKYEFCLITEPTEGNPKGRWPSHGWIGGG